MKHFKAIREACRNLLKESPSLGDSPRGTFYLDDDYDIRQLMLMQCQQDGKLNFIHSSEKVFYSKSTDSFYIDKEDDLALLCELSYHKINDMNVPFMKTVWKKKEISSEILKYLIWDVLFAHNNIIASSDTQSYGGKKLWMNLFIEANKRGLFTYVTDLTKNLNKPIEKLEDLNLYYGSDEFRKFVIVISKNKL